MRAFSTIIAIKVIVQIAVGQNSFVRYYPQAGGVTTRAMHELTSGNLLVGFANNSGVSVITPWGDFVHTKSLVIDTFMMLQSVRKRADNDFAFVGIYSKDTCASPVAANPAIGRMDSLGNVSHAKYFTFNGRCSAGFGGDLMITESNDIVAWGRDRGFFALRAGPTCDLLWAKRFHHHGGGFRFIKELPSGDLLAGMNVDTAGGAVGRMDADGNFIWLKSYFRPRAMITDALIEDDGTMIITGFTDSLAAPGFLNPLPPTYWPKLFVMKLSGAGEVLWCKGYDISPYRWYTRPGARIERHHDGNYILLGNIGGLNHPFGYRPQLMKLDHNGDTLWTRSAGREGHVHDIINMTVCSDGGILYNGQSLSNSPDMFIFKTDSLGYLPCNNRWHATTIVDLFPVDSSFTLTSIDGATAHPAFITEAENPPITIIDGCSTGMEREGMRPSGFRVYPNPTPGRFTLEVPDPLLKDSYYSVFDALGKLLYQRPLPAGATVEEVDLSRFGRGTYVVRLTDPQGVRWERVVLE